MIEPLSPDELVAYAQSAAISAIEAIDDIAECLTNLGRKHDSDLRRARNYFVDLDRKLSREMETQR